MKLLVLISFAVLISAAAVINAYGVAKFNDPCLDISANVAIGHAGDCKKFWRCFDNMPGNLQTCPSGTYFNPKKSYCTTDSSVCRKSHDFVKPVVPLPPVQKPIEGNYDSVPGDIGICASCKGRSLGFAVPILGICEKYCVCGTNTIHICPGKLYFNAEKQVCDERKASGCKPLIYM